MMDTKGIVTLIKFSPQRETLIGNIKDNLDELDKECAGGVLKLCPTR